jgi:hypothetical protein
VAAPKKGIKSDRFAKLPSARGALGTPRWSFDGVVRRVLGFSRAAELERESPGPSSRVAARAAGERAALSPAFDALRHFVRSLDDEARGKLQAVMQAGRQAQALPEAIAALAGDVAGAGDPARELFFDGAVALQDLQRGHALACATAFDLERDLTRWANVRMGTSLDERVWLRFGRELARSRTEELSCFAVVDSGGNIEKLYLRCGMNRWWSFGALIDRPSDRNVAVLRADRSRRSRVLMLSLSAALGRPCRANLKAARRASVAVGARLGVGRAPADAAPAGAG